MTHGAPENAYDKNVKVFMPTLHKRHTGDFGNIEADVDGVAEVNYKDEKAKLESLFSIVNRSIVIHADVDDLGAGGHEDSLTTGNAG